MVALLVTRWYHGNTEGEEKGRQGVGHLSLDSLVM